ncbi:MAG: Tn3 family transposase [Geminicoccaceae bacterium]|nr:Tn3 family transposase [Geminicoccaceae bacterium]
MPDCRDRMRMRWDCAETYSSALATIVDAQHRQPLAARFGEMIVASSDGQHFRAGGPAEARSVVNAKYGREPGAAFYTHISGRYAPFHSRLIPASAGETPFVLGGLLDHGGDFDIEINHADTGGVSDHNFGITYLLGYRFAPRIRNLRDRRLYTFKTITTYPTLRPIIDGRINIRLLRETWDDLLRFAASLQNGSIDAATALKRLAAYPEQNRIASALRIGANRSHALHDRLDPRSRPSASGNRRTREKAATISRARSFITASVNCAIEPLKPRPAGQVASIC